MQNFTTLVYLLDNQKNNSGLLIDINQFLSDADSDLLVYLNKIELEPDDKLIDRTLLMIKREL